MVSLKKTVIYSNLFLFLSSAALANSQLPCNDNVKSERIRFYEPEVVGGVCKYQKQTLMCDADENTHWSGSYLYQTCEVLEVEHSMPLLPADSIIYQGTFHLPSNIGASNLDSFRYSEGVMAYNQQADSLIVVGHAAGQKIAEVSIPNYKKVYLPEEVISSAEMLQDFIDVNTSELMKVEPIKNFRINGMGQKNGKLYINFMNHRNYEDVGANSLVLTRPHDLKNTESGGAAYVAGGLKSSGWITPIPMQWQTDLGGDLLFGAPGKTIPSRTAQGPTAYSIWSENFDLAEPTIISNSLLSFSYNKPLTSIELHSEDSDIVLFNKHKNNDIWTILTHAAFGFIAPGSRTYITIGFGSGFKSGVTSSNDDCRSLCANSVNDNQGMVWFWDLDLLIQAKQGLLSPDDLKPYYYGRFTTPFGEQVTGGTYDYENNRLFIALSDANEASPAKQPLVVVMAIKNETSIESLDLDCGEIKNGTNLERVRYQQALILDSGQCIAENQTAVCVDGNLTPWSGTYRHSECITLTEDKPLISMSALSYQGGFRISESQFGESKYSKADYSRGIFTYNAENHSIFLVGHSSEERVGEFAIPELVESDNIEDFNEIDSAIQNFVAIHNSGKVDTGIEARFRITGLEKVGEKLLVNYVNWYDGNGQEKDTSVYFDDSSQLSNSSIYGPFQLDGAAHAAGWLSPVPGYWQSHFDGQYISGGSQGTSIIGRLSVGPSAFVLNPELDIFEKTSGEVSTVKLLDFPYDDLLTNTIAEFGEPLDVKSILFNDDLDNDLWTFSSGAGYGFIVPNTSTYITLGRSEGHRSGLGYKVVQENGDVCKGYCAKDSEDVYSYYWLWDVKDLLKAKLGLLKPHEIRPYDYGEFTLPIDVGLETINGGAFDAMTNTLYLSIPYGLKSTYSKLPVFLAYKLNVN